MAGNQQSMLKGLADKVKMVYSKCGFDAESQTDTLDMLREIEGWLEYLLEEIHHMPEREVEEAEKKKEAERRDRVRQAKKQEQLRLEEERRERSTARAQAEVVRRTGKPLMFRSAPIRKKKKRQEKATARDEQQEDFVKFFTK